MRCGPRWLSRLPSSSSARSSRSEEHTSELQSHVNIVCSLLLEKKKKMAVRPPIAIQCCRYQSLQTALPRFFVILQHIRMFFFNDTSTSVIYTLSLHDALPI